jgi:hypothetical protein
MVYVTPVAKLVPAVVRSKLPTPATVTEIAVGTHAAESRYWTLKVIGSPSETAAGAARPSNSAASCETPLQLAARAGDPVGSNRVRTAARQRLIRFMPALLP